MFKLQPNPTFIATVLITIPGQVEPIPLEIEFKYLGVKAGQAFFDGLSGKRDDVVLAEIVVGWCGVDTDFSVDALTTLLDNYPHSGAAIFETYCKKTLEAGRKNF